MPARPRAIATVLAATVVLLATACGGQAAPSGAPVADGALTIAMQFAPKAGYAVDTDDAFVLTQLGATETLVGEGADSAPVPRLATAWTRVDPLTWRFTLRSGVVFQDGTPMTAQAVAGSLNWVAKVTAPPRAIKGIGLAAQPDGDGAVLVRTTKPDPIVPLRLISPNTAILAPSAYRGTGPPAVLGTGTGPMTLTATDGVQSATLARNDKYWGGRPKLASVRATYVPDPSARALSFQAGDVDIAQGVPDAALEQAKATTGVDVQAVPAPRTVELLMNESAAPFSDLRVRQAVEKALDRGALAEQALAGAATPASDLFGTAVPWGSTQAPPAPDVDGAKALLAQAGYGPAKPLTVRLATYPNRPELPVLTTAVQAMLTQAGIDAQIEVGDYAAQEPDLLAGRFDMFVLSRSYLTDVPDAGAVLSSDWTCTGSYNIEHHCSPTFDALVAGLAGIEDPKQRQQVFTQAAQQLMTEVAAIPLVHTQENAVAQRVTGFTEDPTGKALVAADTAKTG